MLGLKADFHNILFKHTSSYESTFVINQSKFRWLRMPIGLIEVPFYFQHTVESIMCSELCSHPFPIAIYLDDIVMYGDTQEQVLDDTLEATEHLVLASFMLNLYKSQLI